eukprot:CAMPEP_0177777348 /NCGR_PEP_ID=MMETSP0491_2-20121128/15303_1 /TAXON_ID=63592 /ORGANISM="Tetraselmis chuii, Strain PLY429" /LENGTH=127 /DNA_ID=CAMNT_0019296409 /DNA_START=226 /DNA_END=609 /DNA_ORIENTATION=-
MATHMVRAPSCRPTGTSQLARAPKSIVIKRAQRGLKCKALPEVAFDGSPWVNALASSSLVLGTALSTVAGAYFIRRGVEQGTLQIGMENPSPKRAVKPLETTSDGEAKTGSGNESEEVLESNSTEAR